MITAVTLGMTLAAEPPEDGVMDRPPRPTGERLLGKLVLWRILFVSTLMVIIIEGFYYCEHTIAVYMFTSMRSFSVTYNGRTSSVLWKQPTTCCIFPLSTLITPSELLPAPISTGDHVSTIAAC